MDDFAKKALEAHNKCRKIHQVPSLTWSKDLAKQAQEWVNKLARSQTLKHATSEERKGAGENLSMFSSRYDVAAEEATKMWYSEIEKYDFSNPNFKPGTGHFTQVVWKDSKQLGMARAKTPDGRSTYVVARYSPAGNMMGKFAENVFSSTTKLAPFPKTAQSAEPAQQSQVVQRTYGSSEGTHTKTVVKEFRTQTPQGVRTVRSTITTTSSTSDKQSPSIQKSEQTKRDEPTHKFGSLNISDKGDKGKTSKIFAEPSAAKKPSPARASGSFKEQALQHHNNYRRLHGVPDVTWNNELARGAQAWADKIARMNSLKHDDANKDGENIAFFGGSRDNIAKEAVDTWYNEVKKYQFNRPGFKSGIGHFTQVVWKGSKEIGMAMAQTSDGRNTFVVARYRPAGNMMGDFEGNVFPARR